jgi:hypothetical protein
MKVQFRSGWLDTPGVPAMAAEYLSADRYDERRGHGPHLVARLWTDRGTLLHAPDRTDLDGPNGAVQVFDNVGWFLTEVRKPGVARGEVLFLHPRALKPHRPLDDKKEDRPPGVLERADRMAAVTAFVNAVADSIHPSGTHGHWAACEWAELTFTPETLPAS